MVENTNASLTSEDLDRKAIHAAALGGNSEVVKYLIAKDPASVNEKKRQDSTPLDFALDERGGYHPDVIQYLMKNGGVTSMEHSRRNATLINFLTVIFRLCNLYP